MNSKQNQGTMIMVGALAGAVGLVAFVALLAVGGWAFSPAFFVALLLAIVVAIVLLMGFHGKTPEAPAEADSHAAAAAPASQPAPASAPEPAPAAPAAAAEVVAAPAPAPAPAPEPTPAPSASAEAATAAEASEADKPQMLDAARDGGPDDLKQIKGIGPKLEKMLHGMGVFHFDQVAAWSDRELAWVDQNLEGFKGRASRDEWVSQAKTLASGGATEFSNRVKDGDVY